MAKPIEAWMTKASQEIWSVGTMGEIAQIIAKYSPAVSPAIVQALKTLKETVEQKDTEIAELKKAAAFAVTVDSLVDSIEVYLENLPQLPTLADMKSLLVAEAMRRTNGRRLEAAKILGIGKTTLYRKLRDSDSTEAEQNEEAAFV